GAKRHRELAGEDASATTGKQVLLLWRRGQREEALCKSLFVTAHWLGEVSQTIRYRASKLKNCLGATPFGAGYALGRPAGRVKYAKSTVFTESGTTGRVFLPLRVDMPPAPL